MSKSTAKGKKWTITAPDGKRVHFGAEGYSDYTRHKDAIRKKLYIARHRTGERWGYGGRMSAGFWARWLLWNKPSLQASIQDIKARFGIEITRRD